MSNDYSAHSWGSQGGSVEPQLSEEELRYSQMSPEERQEFRDRLDFVAAKERHDAKEASIKATVDAAMGRLEDAGKFKTFGSIKSEVRDGRVTIRETGQTHRSNDQSSTHVAPPELWQSLNVKVGGIELGAKQAQDMVENGQLSVEAYQAALNNALSRYGFIAPSFR